MLDGIYRLSYETTTLSATGVVVLHDGVFSACDRYYFMLGKYQHIGNALTGTVTFTRHTEHPAQGIPEQFKLVFDGVCSDGFGQLDVHCPDIPQIYGHATFNRLAGLTPD